MSKYDYKNCQSLFGYSLNVHIKYKGICQLCGCGGSDFDLWRQMTVEHLIGRSQHGYLNDIKKLVSSTFPNLNEGEQMVLATRVDSVNTVTACQFCNSTTSRDKNKTSMTELFTAYSNSPDELFNAVNIECNEILLRKKKVVEWKLHSVKEAFDSLVKSKIS